MSRARTLNTEEDHRRFERFLLAHSGNGKARQCRRHPSIVEMTYPQLAEAMQKELGFAPTRQCVATRCEELGIPRRQAAGPPAATGEERVKAALQRDQRFRDKLRKDPVAWAAHLERKRLAGSRARARRRKDPRRHAAFLRRRRVYMVKYRRDQRAAAAVA